MNFELTQEQKLIKQTAKDFAQNELLPGILDRDENKIWPAEAVKKMVGSIRVPNLKNDSNLV